MRLSGEGYIEMVKDSTLKKIIFYFGFVISFVNPAVVFSASCYFHNNSDGRCPEGVHIRATLEVKVWCDGNGEILKHVLNDDSVCNFYDGATSGGRVSEFQNVFYIGYGPQCTQDLGGAHELWRVGCFEEIPYEPNSCNLSCNENQVLVGLDVGCSCVCTLNQSDVDECHYLNESCEYKEYQFAIDERLEVDCNQRDSHGRPLVKMILQERKSHPGWNDALYRGDNDISSCMSNKVIGKLMEVWEYGDCEGAPRPDIYRGTFIYPDQMEMYLGKGHCNYYLKIDWDDPDMWWFNPTDFSVDCAGDCILKAPAEEEPPPVE